MNQPKVCVLATNHSALDSRVFGLEARALVRAGYEVVIIALHPRDEVVDRIKIISLAPSLSRLKRLLSLPRVFRLSVRENADVYHLHDIDLLLVGLLLKWFKGKRVIYDVHEDYPRIAHSRSWIPRPLRTPFSWLVHLFEKGTAKHLDALVLTTRAIGMNFKRPGSTLVRNYPPLDILRHESDRRDEVNDTATLIYAGSITRVRGIFQMIDAVREVAKEFNVKLKIVGASRELDLRSILSDCGDKVELVGWLPQEELYDHILKADIGLILFLPEPGHLTTLPRKLFEYMGLGIPVVVSNFPLYREIVDRFEVGLTVDPEDIEAVAQAILHLLKNPRLAREMGERGRKAVAEEYNWDSEKARLLELYRELIE